MRIFKWTLAVTDAQTLELPQGAGILTVQAQGDMPQLEAANMLHELLTPNA